MSQNAVRKMSCFIQRSVISSCYHEKTTRNEIPMEKRFPEWMDLKKTLHEKSISPPHVNEGDIWWMSVGENIGSEINGKSKLFSRPVIILKKLSYGSYFVIPTTSQARKGSWYVNFPKSPLIRTACLHQARSIDYRRLSSRLGELYQFEFKKLKEAFLKLFE